MRSTPTRSPPWARRRSAPRSSPSAAPNTSATSTSCGWPASWSSMRSSSRAICVPKSSAASPPPAARTAASRGAGTASRPSDRSGEMVDFRLDEEQEALRATVRDFVREQVAPVIAEHYENKSFPYDLVRQMGKMGLFGLPFPEEYGGMGGDYFVLCLALEELARVDSSVAITLEAAVSLGAMPIHRFGTPEQKAQWLPRLTSGESLAAFGLTEPGTGSDAGGTTTRAVLDESTGEWVINGSKAFITNSGTDITCLVTVMAVT